MGIAITYLSLSFLLLFNPMSPNTSIPVQPEIKLSETDILTRILDHRHILSTPRLGRHLHARDLGNSESRIRSCGNRRRYVFLSFHVSTIDLPCLSYPSIRVSILKYLP